MTVFNESWITNIKLLKKKIDYNDLINILNELLLERINYESKQDIIVFCLNAYFISYFISSFYFIVIY